jgi:DNA/RNA endonuclease YhcR with UshA esterase domain
MQDRTLLKIALCGSLLGLVILAIFAATLQLEDSKNIDYEQIGKKAAVTGMIKSISSRNNVTKITVEASCDVHAVFFDPLLELGRGDRVRMLGTVEEYQGRRELIIEKIFLAPQ